VSRAGEIPAARAFPFARAGSRDRMSLPMLAYVRQDVPPQSAFARERAPTRRSTCSSTTSCWLYAPKTLPPRQEQAPGTFIKCCGAPRERPAAPGPCTFFVLVSNYGYRSSSAPKSVRHGLTGSAVGEACHSLIRAAPWWDLAEKTVACR